MSETLRIVFVIPNLGAGGAERVATLLANEWTANGHKVMLVTFDPAGTEPFFALDQGVALHGLSASATHGLSAKLSTNLARVSRLRNALRTLHPDVLVAFMTEANVISLWASRGLGLPVVISERNQPDRPGLGGAHKLARRLTYPFADAMVVQTDAIASWAESRFRIPVHVLPNPVILPEADSRHEAGDVRLIISLGRLAPQKGFDILVESFARIAAKHPAWRLVIYGDGPERPLLERLRARSGCADRISLPGIIRNATEALEKADLFVAPSRFEGYPNALLEALARHLPVLATACPGGTVEILVKGEYGKLVPPDDVPAMTEALDALLSDQNLRDAYASKARRAVMGLDVATVAKRWLDIMTGLTG